MLRRFSALIIQPSTAEIIGSKVEFGLKAIEDDSTLCVGCVLVEVDTSDMLEAIERTAVVDFGSGLFEFGC